MISLRREREPEEYLPYLGHVSDGIVLLDNGGLLAMLRLDGTAWELADADEINARHEMLSGLLRNIADDRIVLTTHLVRTMDDGNQHPAASCRSSFSRDLDRAYRARLDDGRLYRNELFLSVLLRTPSVSGRQRRTKVAPIALQERLEDVLGTIAASLPSYGVHRLGLRGTTGLFSEIAEALRLVLTGQHESVPLVANRLGGAIYTDRVIVGGEAIEIRLPGRSVFAAGFGMREYPASTAPGMMSAMLSAPYCCVLTQTFGFLAKNEATTLMERKQNRMRVAGDKAAVQADELTGAIEAVHSNRLVMGTHHLTLVAFADTLAALAEVAPIAKRHLAEAGAVVVREDRALEAVYWGQLPGNTALRSRPGAVTSRNFAAMSPFQGYPAGPERGHWGEPLTLFRTTGGTPYRFHLHATTSTVKDLGNIFMAGPSGSGKTTLLALILALADRHDATTVLFDKDRGAEILIRAMGGTYLVLPNGSPTGLAPLRALSNTPRDIEFLTGLVTGLVSPDTGLKPDITRRLEQGLSALMSLPPEHRSLSELRAFLGQSDPDGIGARLEKWCRGGSLGWVLDNDTDDLSLGATCMGFDMTAVLDDKATRGPIMAYLFHRVESLVDGRRLILAIDEFWKALADPAFRELVNDKLKTIRKQNGVVILATQSPRDALASPISHSIIEQCPTQILMPNGRADAADYIDGLKLTASEFRAIREDLAIGGGRRFLLKQGETSVACEMDLGGLEDFIAVLSGRSKTIGLMDKLRAEHGDDGWLPHFMTGWRGVAA